MTQPEQTQLYKFAQRSNRLKIWKPTGRAETISRLQLLADTRAHIHANLKRSR